MTWKNAYDLVLHEKRERDTNLYFHSKVSTPNYNTYGNMYMLYYLYSICLCNILILNVCSVLRPSCFSIQEMCSGERHSGKSAVEEAQDWDVCTPGQTREDNHFVQDTEALEQMTHSRPGQRKLMLLPAQGSQVWERRFQLDSPSSRTSAHWE